MLERDMPAVIIARTSIDLSFDIACTVLVVPGNMDTIDI